MGLFDKMNEPFLYKDSAVMKNQMESLREVYESASGETKKLIYQDMHLLQYGNQGEENVLFELMNSFMPMLVLRDLEFEYEDQRAQIDFIVITRKLIYVIECKNLFGDIEVNNSGDFIRTLTFGGRKSKEGIYSPITQNRRHLEIMKAIRKEDKSNIFFKLIVEKFFDDNYKSIIVLANAKTILNVSKAKKEIRDQLIRNDQLIAHIKKLNAMSKNESMSDKQMYAVAESFMNYHKPKGKGYTSKYVIEPEQAEEIIVDTKVKVDTSSLYEELKAYRLMKCKENGIRAYNIFTNAQLEELIIKMPESMGDLRGISGFGEIKTSKYGEDLLKILDGSKS